jgi:hypothetical protein
MTLDIPPVMLRMTLVVCALFATSCATKTLPRRIPVAAAPPPPDPGVVFDVKAIPGVDAGADWELRLDAGSGAVLVTPLRTAGVPVVFGEHTVNATVTMFAMHAVTSTTTTKLGTQTHTTWVRSAVGSCTATLDVSVNYIETRRLEVDVARQNCAIREVEVSPY